MPDEQQHQQMEAPVTGDDILVEEEHQEAADPDAAADPVLDREMDPNLTHEVEYLAEQLPEDLTIDL